MIRYDGGRQWCDCDECTATDDPWEWAQNVRKQFSEGICEMLAKESWVADTKEHKLYCAIHADQHPEAKPIPKDYFNEDVTDEAYTSWLPVECYHGDCDCMHEYRLPPTPEEIHEEHVDQSDQV